MAKRMHLIAVAGLFIGCAADSHDPIDDGQIDDQVGRISMPPLAVRAKFHEVGAADAPNGWTPASDNAPGFTYQESFEIDDAPYQQDITAGVGTVHISLSDHGRFGVLYNYEDYDAGTRAAVYLPAVDGALAMQKGTSTTLEVAGGDFSGGSWEFYGQVEIRIDSCGDTVCDAGEGLAEEYACPLDCRE